MAARASVLLLGLAVLAWAPDAVAATQLSPAAGAVTSPTPTFVVALAAGETPVNVHVSTAAQVTVGSVDVASCFLERSGSRASCTLAQPLKDGTYYWRVLYQSASKCVSVNGQKYCVPETRVTPSARFVVRAQASPPPAPASPPTPAPPPPGQQPPPAPAGSATVLRPTDGGDFAYTAPEQTFAGGAAVVHYVTTGLDAPPLNDDDGDGVPDYVEHVAAAADSALGYYAAHGLQPPPADTAGPDTRLDVYIKHFRDPDLYGLTVNPAVTPHGTFVVVSPHLDPSPKVARGSIDTTVAHELFHVVQFGYLPSGGLPDWVAEGSATAMSLLVYPNIDDLTNTDYFDEWLHQPWRPLFDERSYCDHCYGGGLWWDFLAQADPKLLPTYFRRLAQLHAAGTRYGLGLAVLDETMREQRLGSLAGTFSAFSVALYHAGFHPAATYGLRAGARRTVRLNGLAAHYVPITVPAHARGVAVRVWTRAVRRPRVVLVVGGPKGRIVAGGAVRFRSRAEREHVLAVVTSSGPTPISYRIAVLATR